MSGILGIWNRDGRPVDRSELLRLRATLAHRGGDGEGLEIQGSVALACCLRRIAPEAAAETQPLVSSSGVVVVFDGRLDNREELLSLLRPMSPVSPDSPDPALVIAAYDAIGDAFPERLNGDFALGLYDPRRSTMLLARDSVGVRPLYYYIAHDLLMFASEIKALLAHARIVAEPDDDALADLMFNSLTGEDSKGLTFFRDIFSVLPAHVSVVSPETMVTRCYWDFDSTRSHQGASTKDAVDGFRHYFEQSVRRRLRSAGPVAVSVSGGVDSSAIFCVAETLRRSDPSRFPAVAGLSYTAPDGTPSDEKAFLLHLERAYGVSITRFDNLPRGGIEGSREGVWQVEVPFLDSDWSGTHAFLTGVRAQGARVLLTGHWGDQFLSDDAYFIDLCREGRLRELWNHLNEYVGWLDVDDPNYVRKRFFKNLMRHTAPAPMLSAFRRARHSLRRSSDTTAWYAEQFRLRAIRVLHEEKRPHASEHARSLYRNARSRYHALCMEWNNKVAACHGLEMAFPFLDRDLIAFLMGLPGDMVSLNGVPKGVLREALSGVLPEAIAHRRSKADFTSVVNEGMAKDHHQLVQCLGSGGAAIAFGYLRPDGLSEIARRKPSVGLSTCTLSWALKDLLSLELWLQLFFGPRPRQARTEAS